MKLLVLLVCLISTGFAAHVNKDLEADIATAQRDVEYFTVELNAFSNRLLGLESELNLDVSNTCGEIINAMTNLTAPNVDEVADLMDTAYNQSIAAIESLNFNLEQTSLLLVIINGNLQNDLTSLNASISTLETYNASGDAIFSALFVNLQASVASIEAAILTGLEGLEGPNVTRAWVSWIHVKDVLLNQQLLTENVKIVFDARATNAVNSLKVVAAQA
ncbi:uncharacterized protein LOC135948023 [Cloeon dipterum]|uniref:uncharacterized protein LOC135948023 n=1 Tax=Cloeon dipterum TaxID=197152 RepID=UPI00321F6FDE